MLNFKTYSYFKVTTGFALAANMALKLVMANATTKANSPDKTKIVQLMDVRYGNPLNQSVITRYPISHAKRQATKISQINSFEMVVMIFMLVAPNTLRIPISFVFCSARKDDSPIKPIAAIKMIINEKIKLS